jgi:hypothetical protein
MTKMIAPAVLALALAASGGAFAATAPASAKPMSPKAEAAKVHADCMKQWKAQKTHSQSKKDFLATCTKAG